MRRAVIPVDRLFAWGKLNGAEFSYIDIKDITSLDGPPKGAGLVSASDQTADKAGSILIAMPQDLILSQAQVELYAAVDNPLKLVLDAAGAFGKSPRGAILIFLLVQITNASPDFSDPLSVTNPHTDYVKLLPSSFLLPTFYTEEEKDLLFGTSLHDALDQKVRSLEKEFDQLRKWTQDIPWCQQCWWDEEDGRLTFDDWMLVDALYRSRALDLPGTGHAMVPCIDMANHASGAEAVALYETDHDGRAVLQAKPGKTLVKGEEVTITYGDEKGACEMIFSYGFLEPQMSNAKVMFLDLDIPDDDPLRLAKKTANEEAPGVALSVDNDGKVQWESKYIWWACVNQEDGIDFRVALQNDGNRQLEVLWKDRRIDPSHLCKAVEDDPKREIFHLRALVMLQERINLQARRLEAGGKLFSESQGQPGVRDEVWALIGRLRSLEDGLLSLFGSAFEEQKAELLSSDSVKRYLETAQADTGLDLPEGADEDDFS